VGLQQGQLGRQPHHFAGGDPEYHRVSVPDHKPLRLGTFNAILREIAAAKRSTREAILATL